MLQGDETHVSGWDLVYDDIGYVEIDPEVCGYSTYLGSAMSSTRAQFETDVDADADEDVKAHSKWDEAYDDDGLLSNDPVITDSLRGKVKPKWHGFFLFLEKRACSLLALHLLLAYTTS